MSAQPLKPFKIEQFFGKYEFNVPHALSFSDCEPLQVADVVSRAAPDLQEMWTNLKLAYTESTGHPMLKEEIQKTMYPSLSKDDVVVLAPEEGIYLTMRAVLSPGDHVVAISPAYQSLYGIAEAIGCEVSPWNVNEKNGSFSIDIDALKSLLRPTTKLLVVNFPHNPTGYLPTLSEFNAIIDLCKANDVLLFSDEMYRFLEYNPKDRLPAACDAYENAISLSGMSKTFSMPGIRIGWIATKNDKILKRIAELKDYTTICCSAPSEILALMGLRDREKIVSDNLEIIRKGIEAVETFVSNHKDHFEFLKPRAGPIACIKLVSGLSASKLSEQLIQEVGILILPGEKLDMEDVYFRISFGRVDIPQVLDIWHEHLVKTEP